MDGLLSRLLKRSAQRSLNPTWSLIMVMPLEDSKGEQCDLEGSYTVFRKLKNLALWESA